MNTNAARMDRADLEEGRKHILIIGAPNYPHARPILELAKRLSRHYHVTFAISQHFIPKIHAANLWSRDFKFEILGIADNYTLLPATHMERLARMLAFLAAGTKDLFTKIPFAGRPFSSTAESPITLPVDLVIADDSLAPALWDLHQLGVPLYLYSAFSCNRLLFYLSVTPHSPSRPDSEEELAPCLVLPRANQAAQFIPTVTIKRYLAAMREILPFAGGVICSTADCEVDPDVIAQVKAHPYMEENQLFNISLLASDDEKDKSWENHLPEEAKKWLDNMPKRSVIYAGIRQHKQLEKQQRVLMDIGQPFILAVGNKERQYLPDEVRSGKAGQIDDEQSRFPVFSWLDQRYILQHPAIAVFLSECDLISTYEALSSGVPVVAWPLVHDQLMNAEELVRKGTAVLIEGTGENADTVISKEVIENALKMVGEFHEKNNQLRPFHGAAGHWEKELNTATEENGTSQKAFLELVRNISWICGRAENKVVPYYT